VANRTTAIKLTKRLIDATPYLIPFRYEHTAITACTKYGSEVRDRIAVLA
jgi:hypothetical protein